jgi:hypothetical protein
LLIRIEDSKSHRVQMYIDVDIYIFSKSPDVRESRYASTSSLNIEKNIPVVFTAFMRYLLHHGPTSQKMTSHASPFTHRRLQLFCT